jgi:hypothetical protein
METIGEDAELQAVKEKETIPQGWKPGVEWDGRKGTITSGALSGAPTGNWEEIFRERGLDTDVFEVDGNIKWTSYDGWAKDSPDEPAYSAIRYSYKADIKLRREAIIDDRLDVHELYKEARKVKLPKTVYDGDSTFVIMLSDWQIGNPDGGGVEAQILSLAQLPALVERRVKQLRKSGVKIGTIALLGLGDLFENCDGFYRNQEFSVQLDMRSQERVIREGVFRMVETVAKLAPKVIVAAIGGNHGEKRNGGSKYTTTKADNTDVSVFEQVYDMCSQNPKAFGHLDWRIPNDQLAISMELSGQHVAITHGHIAKSRGSAMQSMWGWWEKQTLGRYYPGVADAEYLLVGHYHHLNIKQQLGRTIVIAPSLTDVNAYYGDSQGVSTSPGTATMVFDANGMDHLSVLK